MGIIRLTLAIEVLLYHCPPGMIARYLHPGLAVQCFYAISGFLIQLVVPRYENTTRHWYLAFYESRFLRLMPMYWIFTLLTLAVSENSLLNLLWNSGDIRAVTIYLLTNTFIVGQDVLRLLSYDAVTHQFSILAPELINLSAANGGHSVLASAFSITTQSWSIAVEILFYSVAPWLLLRSTPAVIAIIAASIGFRFILAYYGYVHNFFLNGIILCEIAIFLSGSLACRFYRAWLASGELERLLAAFIPEHYLRTLLPIAGFALVGMLMDYYFEGWRLFPAGGKWGEGLFEVPYAYWAVVAATVCASPWIFHIVGRYKWDRWIGDLSYPVYISHMFIIEMVTKMHVPDNQVSSYVLGFTLLISVILMYAVERPVDALRHRWFKRMDTKPPIPVALPLHPKSVGSFLEK